jgi:uncharacterized protein YdeI (YjbR/CyaY-like superfamily)
MVSRTRAEIDDEEVIYFSGPVAWRRWLARNHQRRSSQWVGFHKRATGRPSLTWPQSVDQALCFGWIDGVRKSVDEGRYKIRFSPRKPGSRWSKVNIGRAAELTTGGLMQPAGRAVFENRTRAADYSYEETRQAKLSPAFRKRFRANAAAWAFFQARPPWYRKAVTHWVTSAKKEETRERRLALLMEDSAHGRTLKALTPRRG